MSKALTEQCEMILDELKKLEPSQNEVFATWNQDMKVVFENRDFSISSSHVNTTFGIRSIVGGRLGFVTTNAVNPESLKEAAREVQMVARMSPASEHHQISKAKSGSSDFSAFDPKMADLAPKEAFRFAQMMVDEAQGDSRVSLDRAEFSISQTHWCLLNSEGVKRTASATSSNWFAMGMAHEKENVTGFDYDGGGVSNLADLESSIQRTMRTFRESVIGALNPKPARTYNGLILLHPYAVMDLLVGMVAANCSGLRHQDGMSSWKEKVHEKVASDLVTVIEDPQNQKRFEGWSPFDREGVITSRHELVKRGTLNFVAHNCFSAHRAKTEPTGNAVGGARGLPGLGFANLSFEIPKEAVSEEALQKQMGEGLVLKRFSGNEDLVSGHFSGVAKNSWWQKGGQREFPVQEVMVAGNLFEVLQNVKAVGDRAHDLMGGGRAPFVLVDKVSVTAGDK